MSGRYGIKAQSRKLSELSKTEQNRLAKLDRMLDELTRGKNVQNRRLAAWLTEAEYEVFLSDWEIKLKIRKELKDKSDELKRYEDKLKKAIFNYSRAEGYSAKGKHSTAEKFHKKIESVCEEALEILQKLLHTDASIQQWFDRALDFDAGEDLGLTPAAIPRVITSRSLDKHSADIRVMAKREVKISILERAISALLAVGVADNEERKERDSRKLAEFLD